MSDRCIAWLFAVGVMLMIASAAVGEWQRRHPEPAPRAACTCVIEACPR